MAQACCTFVRMRTYYCVTIEEALQRAKAAAKRPLHFYGSIILPSGRKGFAVYKDGKVLEQYSYMNKKR